MVSYAPLDFDKAAEAAASEASAAARSSSSKGAGPGAVAAPSKASKDRRKDTPVVDAIDESKLRKVLYVSGEEKDVHVSASDVHVHEWVHWVHNIRVRVRG